ncbi:MAG TPA: MFS transporter [Halomicronema sp.]
MKSSEFPPAISSRSGRFVLWRSVLALAFVQGSIILSWVIYRAYLPYLLTEFGYAKEFAATILLIENILAVGMEPLFGSFSDSRKRFIGTQFPLISLGVILSSAVFILIPCFGLFLQPNGFGKYLLPAFLIFWALAMAMFRSPVIALLGEYAATPMLPQAASFLMVAGGLIGAFAPVSQEFLLSLGPVSTFSVASLVLLLAVMVLRSFHPPASPPQTSSVTINPFPFEAFGLIFLTGLFVNWAVSFSMLSVGKLLGTNLSALFPQIDLKSAMLTIGIVMALASLPAGWLATRLGNRRGILAGMAVGASSLLLWSIPAAGILGVVFLVTGLNFVVGMLGLAGIIVGLSLVNVGVFPFALGLMPSRGGLGIGGYFGGVAAAASLAPMLFGQVQKMPAFQGGILGVLMFAMAGGCVILSRNLNSSGNDF